MDSTDVSRYAKNWLGTRVAITGGTGSFGSTMLAHLLKFQVGEVLVLSRDEAKQDALRRKFLDGRVSFVVGDVRDAQTMRNLMTEVDYVFHAAAIKQVPTGEFFPSEAVRTNILGSQNAISAAVDAKVKAVVCLSTDKAVYPINAMGMSKALMEKTAAAIARQTSNSDTRVCITRYGNVMNSRGSVIPLFIEQVKQGKPITVTNGKMTRFLMSLSDSVRLVEDALFSGETGDLFVRKAPGCTIATLSKAITGLLGREDYPLKVIGTRHGEKLHETLLSREEIQVAEDRGDNFRVPLDTRGLDYELYFDQGAKLNEDLTDYSSNTTRQLEVSEVQELLMSIPEIAQSIEST